MLFVSTNSVRRHEIRQVGTRPSPNYSLRPLRPRISCALSRNALAARFLERLVALLRLSVTVNTNRDEEEEAQLHTG
jgi:hypothetical protein